MEELAKSLVNFIYDEFKEEFREKHLSRNLINTITIDKDGDKWLINIPAQVYDMAKYISEGVIIYNKGNTSYAEELNKEGSYVNGRYVGNHIGYVENCIMKGVQKWIDSHSLKAKVEML